MIHVACLRKNVVVCRCNTDDRSLLRLLQLLLFLNKRHESPIRQKYHTYDNWKSMKTSESKEISFFLRLSYLGNISLQIEKEIRQFLIENRTLAKLAEFS